jgi:hypothetical protein
VPEGNLVLCPPAQSNRADRTKVDSDGNHADPAPEGHDMNTTSRTLTSRTLICSTATAGLAFCLPFAAGLLAGPATVLAAPQANVSGPISDARELARQAATDPMGTVDRTTDRALSDVRGIRDGALTVATSTVTGAVTTATGTVQRTVDETVPQTVGTAISIAAGALEAVGGTATVALDTVDEAVHETVPQTVGTALEAVGGLVPIEASASAGTGGASVTIGNGTLGSHTVSVTLH